MPDYGNIVAAAFMVIVVLGSPMSMPSKIQFVTILALIVLGTL